MTSPFRVQVTTLIPTKGASFHWFAMEVADAASVAECYRQLCDHGVILGERLKLDGGAEENGTRVIVAREPIIVGRGIVATIFSLPFDLTDRT